MVAVWSGTRVSRLADWPQVQTMTLLRASGKQSWATLVERNGSAGNKKPA